MTMSMRRSRVLKKLRAGEIVYSYKVNLTDPRGVELACRFGFDCIWSGHEHVPNDLAVIESHVYASKCYDVDLLCRVPRGSYSDLIHPLEMDAAGIMVPHVMSAEDARNIVRTTRFHPLGRRPVDGGNADGAYCNIPFTDYIRQANEERFVILQIEDPEAVEELEKIAQVDGYDMLLFGAGDFSHAIGAPAQMDHPLVVDTRKRLAKVCAKYGKFAGAVGTPANCGELIEMGYQFINVGADVIGLSDCCRRLAEDCGFASGGRPVSMYGEARP